jgi:hypothetical protein
MLEDLFFRGDYASTPVDVPILLLGLLLSFIIGHMLAWTYMLTHAGLSYSRSFVNSLVLLPILVALVMQVLSNNIVTAFGLMAVFAIVRFRNILRDTLDTGYILACIVLGMAAGTNRFAVALLSCLIITGVLLSLWYTAFGSRHRYDLIVNLHWARPLTDQFALTRLLERHSLKINCASQRSTEGFEGTDFSYRLLLRDSNRVADLLLELRDLPGVSRVTSLKAEDESEV